MNPESTEATWPVLIGEGTTDNNYIKQYINESLLAMLKKSRNLVPRVISLGT